MRPRHLLALAAFLLARSAPAQPAPALPYRIPVLQYHLIGDTDSRWKRSRDGFRRDLQLLYDRGYRPITVAQLIDRDFDIPPGTSPVVFTFDDASPGQFSYVERDGKLDIDPNSALGIWLAFSKRHPDWKPRATFCTLSGASEGHAFFGDTGVAGQKSAWRLPKVRFLAQQGFELCNHTLYHARLDRLGDAAVQEQIARGVLAIDSAVAGHRVRTFALPLGLWPRNRELARAGQWTDPKTTRTIAYRFDAILEVTGALQGTPYGPGFNPLSIPRTQIIGENLGRLLDAIEPKRFRPRPASAR
ncbi:MAG: polysaccharide deacetylase family protein [Gemmatimonadetes bacterium]|nr:polysaccharide deacetylase family protein [Gemmatimonadota bacterium]